MGASAQALDGDGFDRAAAEAYLETLRPNSAARTRARPAAESSPMAADPLMAAFAPQPRRRRRASRTLPTVIAAIIAPAIIGLGVAYRNYSKPLPPSAPAGSADDATQNQTRPILNAYVAGVPEPVKEPQAADPEIARSERVERVPARPKRAPGANRQVSASAPAEDPAPDFPAYGILDPAPSVARPTDPAAN